jgi:RNA polymerase subunit RPABC4/transcription elongation factor Spt4
MTEQTLQCDLKGYADEPSTASVDVVQLDGADRLRRGLKHLGICWGAAVVSVFIPVAHLFLVPGLFIAGIVLLVRDVRIGELVRQARGTCPDCGTEQTLDLTGRWRGGAEIACRNCHRLLRLTLSPAS